MYQQWLYEKEEKEQILENYNIEKERFEQVIDLLQSQWHQEERIKQRCSNIDNDLKRRETVDISKDLKPIPFPIKVNSDSKEVYNQTPAANIDGFQSPRPNNTVSMRSDIASPAE